MRAAPKARGLTESAWSWSSFKWRSHASTHGKETVLMKGPAFWDKPVTPHRRNAQARRLRPAKWRGGQFFTICKNYSLRSCLHLVVYILVAVAFASFLVLMSLISAYVTISKDINSFKVELAARQYRLAEAVRNYVSNKSLICVSCPESWMQSAGTCYLFTNETMSWQDCINHCKAENASLFMGHTEGEMDLLMLETQKQFTIVKEKRVLARYWIGLIYKTATQRWHWADGEYLHIRIRELDKKQVLVEDTCAAFHDGRVNYRECTHAYHCLCKREAS